MGATTRRDRIAIGTAAGVGGLLWLLSGVAWHSLVGADGNGPALGGLVVPPTLASELVSGDAGLAGAAVTGALVVAAVIAGVGLLVLPGGATGAPTTVLALWWGAVVGGVLGSLVSLVIMLQPAAFAAQFPYSQLGSNCWWGIVYGWLPGLAAVGIRRRSRTVPNEDRVGSRGARSLALVAGVVAVVGWLVLGTVRAAITAVSPDALSSIGFLYPLPVVGALPGDGYFLRLVGTALLAGAITALVAWFAVRSADTANGLRALGLAVWFAAIVGSIVGPFLVHLTRISALPPEAEGFITSYVIGPLTGGGLPGLVYGWVPALGVVLLVLRRRTTEAAVDDATLVEL